MLLRVFTVYWIYINYFTFMASLIVLLLWIGTAKLHRPDINTFPFPLSTWSEAFLHSLPKSTWNIKYNYLIFKQTKFGITAMITVMHVTKMTKAQIHNTVINGVFYMLSNYQQNAHYKNLKTQYKYCNCTLH